MKNIIDQTPSEVLHNMIKFSMMYSVDRDIKNKKVLDIGCGYGWFEIYACERGVKSVVGMEITQLDLVTAKKYVRNPNVHFVIGDATRLPFANNSFDTVVAWEVLEHIPASSEGIMFSEIKRVLKSGGICYLSTPCRSFWSVVLDPAFWLAGHRHYTKTDIVQFASAEGLELSDFRTIGGAWVSLFMLNLYIAKWVFRRSPFLRDTLIKKINSEFPNPRGFHSIYCTLNKV